MAENSVIFRISPKYKMNIASKIDSEIVKIMSYGPLHMSKYAEFRGEFDGDDENSSKLFRIAVFDEILFEKNRKIDKTVPEQPDWVLVEEAA